VKKLKNLNDLFDIAEKILREIKPKEKICLVHHDDTDGCCSAVLFSIMIHDLIGDYPLLFPVTGIENVNSKLFYHLRTANPDYVFVFDVTVNPKTFDSFKGFILDHHIFFNIEDRENMIYLNPRIFEKKDENVTPTSYMVYKILKRFSLSEKVAWIAAIGITEDHRVNVCKDVFEDVKKETPELIKIKEVNQEVIEKSFFGELWDMVRSGRMVKGNEGAKTAVMALIECKDRPDKLINGLTQHSLALRRFYDKLIYETDNCLRDVERRGIFYKDKKVIIYEQGKMGLRGLTSFLSDKIRQKYPEWIAYVINKIYDSNKAKISIRLEQKNRSEDLVKIVEDLKKKIPHMKGGGHKSAVGVILDLDYVNDFEKQFLNSIKAS
jgi:single-stranded DNA-specific DHH superfamily exonuclease